MPYMILQQGESRIANKLNIINGQNKLPFRGWLFLCSERSDCHVEGRTAVPTVTIASVTVCHFDRVEVAGLNPVGNILKVSGCR